eukprot:5053962-Pleurochrysis_carterae.AAC.1
MAHARVDALEHDAWISKSRTMCVSTEQLKSATEKMMEGVRSATLPLTEKTPHAIVGREIDQVMQRAVSTMYVPAAPIRASCVPMSFLPSHFARPGRLKYVNLVAKLLSEPSTERIFDNYRPTSSLSGISDG